MKDDFVGFKELDSQILNCGDCNYPLVDIVLIETNEDRINRGLGPQKSQFRIAKCPKCSGSSFNSKVFEGSVIVGPAKKDLKIESDDVDINDNGVIFTTLNIEKE